MPKVEVPSNKTTVTEDQMKSALDSLKEKDLTKNSVDMNSGSDLDKITKSISPQNKIDT